MRGIGSGVQRRQRRITIRQSPAPVGGFADGVSICLRINTVDNQYVLVMPLKKSAVFGKRCVGNRAGRLRALSF